MSKCPVDYKWVKVPRSLMPPNCKGLMKDYFKIAFASAYKNGTVKYCGYENEVKVNQWVGGPAGLKRLLERRSRESAIDAVFLLEEFEYVTLFAESGKKATIDVLDLITPQTCSVKEQISNDTEKYITEHYNELDISEIENLRRYASDYNEKCYVNDNSGYICVPRNLCDRLVERGYVFDTADALYDLYIHTVHNYENNPFSQKCPCIMYDRGTHILTLNSLGERWGWSLSKVSRFFKKYSDYFSLVKLQSSYGCVIFNKVFQTDSETTVPTQEECFAIVNDFKARGEYFGVYDEMVRNKENNCSENQYVNSCIDGLIGFDAKEEYEKMLRSIAYCEAIFNNENNELGTYSFNSCEEQSKQDKVSQATGLSKNSFSTLISDYVFDAKKCVLQFLTYNTLFVIKNFNNYLTAPTGYLSNLMVSSNNTLNNRVCPKCWTAVQKGVFANTLKVSFVRPLSIPSAIPVSPIVESNNQLYGNSISMSLCDVSTLQVHSPPVIEKVSTKSLNSLVKQVFTKVKSKIKYLFKGVQNNEQTIC